MGLKDPQTPPKPPVFLSASDSWLIAAQDWECDENERYEPKGSVREASSSFTSRMHSPSRVVTIFAFSKSGLMLSGVIDSFIGMSGTRCIGAMSKTGIELLFDTVAVVLTPAGNVLTVDERRVVVSRSLPPRDVGRRLFDVGLAGVTRPEGASLARSSSTLESLGRRS